MCRDASCSATSWSDVGTRIAAPRLKLTDKATRFATRAVGRDGRSVTRELDCDWYMINDSVRVYQAPLVEDPNRFGSVDSLGLAETLFASFRGSSEISGIPAPRSTGDRQAVEHYEVIGQIAALIR